MKNGIIVSTRNADDIASLGLAASEIHEVWDSSLEEAKGERKPPTFANTPSSFADTPTADKTAGMHESTAHRDGSPYLLRKGHCLIRRR